MTLKQLRFFLGVLQAGSFTKAAETLHVAQPALGMQIRKLEEELGVKLLTRHSRGVVATEAGERLARQAVELIGQAEQVRRDIIEMDNAPHGPVVVGLTGAAMQVLCDGLVETCRREYPDLDLTLTEAMSHRLTGWLEQDRLDVAVTCNPPVSPAAVSEPLTIEALYLVAPPGHALAEGPDITLRAALKADLVLPPEPSMVRRRLADAARANGAALQAVCEAESVIAMKALVRRGLGCAVMAYGAVRREVEDGRLAALRIVDPPLTRTLYLACPRDRSDAKAVQAVCREFRALVAEAVESGAAGWRSIGPAP